MSDTAIDKAVILARGLGTRMRKVDEGAGLETEQSKTADTGIKALMPIDRPFLEYVLTALADAGYRRICLVVGPEHDAIRKHFGEELQCERLHIEFAVQESPLGTADAVAAAEQFADGGHFLCINSDNYYPAEALKALREADSPALAAFERNAMLTESNIPPERISRFAVVKVREDGCMEKIVEKPSPETLASLPEPIRLSMNCWRFGPEIFPAARAISPSSRGELEIPDAVQYSIDQLGCSYRVLTFHAPVLDLSSRNDVAAVADKLAGTEVKL
ncbi:MAG: nucleotidyltransferase family protein [Planctomycetota bacterium]